MNVLARPVSAIVLPAFAAAVFLAAAPGATADEPGGDQPVAEDTPVTTIWDFVSDECWSECTDDTFTGATNVNDRVWTLSDCFVDPENKADGEMGCISLFSSDSHAISPAFFGVVTQVTTIFRPKNKGATRKVTLLASTDGGDSFFSVTNYAVTNKVNYTDSVPFNPPLDGGDFGVIFCASNSGSGTVYFRRLTIEGTTTTPEEPDAHPYSPFGASPAGQPQGALSGTVLYLSAGHGYTANDDTTDWTTGSAPSCGMVEDFGNLDQLNFFALQAWKAGATIVPMRPLGYQTNEVVIDNVETDPALSSRVTYGGAWANSSRPPYYGLDGDVGYSWTYTCSTGTTAWASYRPNLPVAGEYPVYVWARPGSDRVPQLYRVHHAGGGTDVRVDHRQVGNGWVWLGNFWFDAGTNGCVNISNYAPGFDEGTVIADAVRFGNGMGDIGREAAGISGYPRELEGARYWIQSMVDGAQGLSTNIYDSARTDRDDNTTAPNHMACAMCTDDVSPGSRLYLSFHSRDDLSKRGCMALYDPSGLDGSSNLARCIADSIVTDMTLAHAHGIVEKAWKQECPPVGETSDAEIGGDIAQKMDAAIVEVASHGIESDAAILKSLRGREWLARSALRGVIRHLAVPEVFPPDAPIALSAINSGTNTVTLSWEMPVGTNRLSSPHTGFVVYVSTNGSAFGNPVAISSSADSCSHTFAELPDGTTCFFRVCAVNEGGESLSSPVAGARLTDDGSIADVLVVDGFRRIDASITPAPFYDRLCGTGGNVALVRPKMINSFDYVKEHGNAIAKAGKSFDFSDASRVTSADLARYPWVVWCLGRESIVDETFSYEEQQLLSAFLDHHGALCVSGSDIGWDLYANGSAGDRAFFTNWLHCGYVDNDAGTGTIEYKSGTYFANTNDPFADFNYTNALTDTYAAASPDVLAACGDAFTAAFYGATDSEHAAIIACSNSTCRTVVMGFPFETIPDEANRNKLMGKILGFFSASSVGPSWSEANINENTGPGGIIEINLKSHLSGYPSPAITLWDASYDFCGNTDNPINPATYDFTGEIFTFRAPTNATSALCIFSFRAGDNADLSVNITVGEAPVWRPIPEILLDLDTGATNNLREYVSGLLPIDLSLDGEHTDAAPGGYVFDPSSGLLAITPSSSPLTNIFTFVATNPTNTASVTVTNVIRRLDTDDNGIPDWWTTQNFGGPTSCNPILDPDEDGYTNYEEFKLGTAPNDSDSHFALASLVDESTADTSLYWPSATGVSYTLYFSTNLVLTNAGFTIIADDIAATPPHNDYDIIPTDPTTFYQLRATYLTE